MKRRDFIKGGAAVLGGSLNGLGAAGTATQMDDFVRADQFGMHPLVLSTNEGITVSWGATALATGLATFTIIVSWAEVVVF